MWSYVTVSPLPRCDMYELAGIAFAGDELFLASPQFLTTCQGALIQVQ